jgi:hypothetical protein
MNSDVRTSDCSRLAFAPVGYHRYAVGQSQSAKSRHFSLVGWIIRSFVQIITGSEAVSERSTFCSLNSLRFLIIGVQCSQSEPVIDWFSQFSFSGLCSRPSVHIRCTVDMTDLLMKSTLPPVNSKNPHPPEPMCHTGPLFYRFLPVNVPAV